MRLSQSKKSKPKSGGGQREEEEDDPERLEHEHRLEIAVRKGMVVSSSAVAAGGGGGGDALDMGLLASKSSDDMEDAYAGLTVSDQIMNSDGRDIVKKGSARKNRFLLVFSGWLNLASGSGGKLGVLTDLDTRNPSLCIDFPQLKGSLKMLGTIVFPRTKYAVLNFEVKKHIVVDEIFDSMVVFCKANWIKWREGADDAEGGETLESVPREVFGKLTNGGGASDDEAMGKGGKGAGGETGDYRCGATTGEPKVVRIKKRKRKAMSLFSDALKSLGDLEELDGDLEDFENEDLSDSDSDFSYQEKKKGSGKKGSGGGSGSGKATRSAPKRKRKQEIKIKEDDDDEDQDDQDDNNDDEDDDDVVEVVADDDDEDDDEDNGDESDWSGMD